MKFHLIDWELTEEELRTIRESYESRTARAVVPEKECPIYVPESEGDE